VAATARFVNITHWPAQVFRDMVVRDAAELRHFGNWSSGALSGLLVECASTWNLFSKQGLLGEPRRI
jgi:hypothetical protein